MCLQISQWDSSIKSEHKSDQTWDVVTWLDQIGLLSNYTKIFSVKIVLSRKKKQMMQTVVH